VPELKTENQEHGVLREGRLAPGFRMARTPKGDLRIYGPRIDMTLEAAIEMGVLRFI